VSGDAPLRLTLDVTAVPANPAGAGRYTVELARALGERSDVALTLVARRDDGRRWGGLGAADRRPRVMASAPTARPVRLAWEQLRLPALLRSVRPDVHHGPHYTMPERADVPCVVTVHDCTFFDHPEWHERSKVLVFRRAIRTAAKRAAAIVCVSETTARRLQALCPVEAPIVVAPHGVDHRRFTPAEPDVGSDTRALERLGVDPGRPLVVFVGTIEPRKGVADLVAAFDRVAASHPDALLVLAGQEGWGDQAVGRALGAADHPTQVRRTGYVPDDAVPALLRRARVVAYPSLEEGYGLPALEALACGTPLVTTSGTAMAELADGAAVLVPPGRPAALAEALDTLLSGDEAGAEERRAKGLEVAAGRTWAASAARHLEAYRLAVSGRRPNGPTV